MIARISGEGQFILADELLAELNEHDNASVAAVEAGDEAAFRASFDALLGLVRSRGEETADDDLSASDLILPPADLTFAEAGEEFTGEGLIPD